MDEKPSDTVASESPILQAKEALYDRFIKRYLDYVSFFRQRRLIQKDAGIILADHSTRPRWWKRSFNFALQGIVITSIIEALVIYGVHALAGSGVERAQRIAEGNIADVQHEIETIEKQVRDLREAGWDLMDEKKAEVRMQLASRRSALFVARIGPTIQGVSQVLGTPLGMLIPAYTFSFFLRRARVARIENLEHARSAYLYVVTTSAFWLNVYMVAAITIGSLLTVDQMLEKAGAYVVLSYVVFIFWAVWVLARSSRSLQAVFAVEPPAGSKAKPRDILLTRLVYTNVVTNISLYLIFYGLGWGAGRCILWYFTLKETVV